jgi:urea transport system ATP-binding protein
VNLMPRITLPGGSPRHQAAVQAAEMAPQGMERPRPWGRRSAATAPSRLSIESASISYGESLVVHDVTLHVDPGEVVCLMGRNGVGKSTLIKSIVGLVPLRRGRVRLGDRDLTGDEPHRRARAGIGYVPQGRGIFPYLTVWENLLLGFESTGRVEAAALHEVVALFPVLGRMARRVAGTLSGGQQQQLAIGRALVGRPRLLLLDEPTEGIQPSIVDEIEALILALRGATSVLVVEQFLDFARAVADRYYVMEGGTIVSTGADLSPETLREHLAV